MLEEYLLDIGYSENDIKKINKFFPKKLYSEATILYNFLIICFKSPAFVSLPNETDYHTACGSAHRPAGTGAGQYHQRLRMAHGPGRTGETGPVAGP